ncbi:MAG: hypothetical protein J7L25_02885 [Deltaproteobacteria bacterium]|nr:hypothetical protein [Candidatus Tharpella aukensis]
MKYKLLIISVVVACMMSFSPLYASEPDSAANEKPSVEQSMVITIEAIVEAVDYEKRTVTLKGPDGTSVTVEVQDYVKNFDQVDVGDLLSVEYIESIKVEAFAPGKVKTAAETVMVEGKAQPGEKPSEVVVQEVAVLTTIEAIDKENQQVTLKNAQGQSKTVQVRNPDNLDKVEVGDQVLITYTAALGISVTEREKPAEK